MVRVPLPLLFGGFFHIYGHAASAQLLVDGDYRAFLAQLRDLILPVAAPYAYSLLPDHFHLLLRIRTPTEQAVQLTGSAEARAAFERHPLVASRRLIQLAQTFGFDAPLTCTPVEYRRNATLLVIYLHHDPQTHGHVSRFADWRWTSYAALAGRQPTYLERDAVLAWFLGRKWFEDAHWHPVDTARICHLIRDEWEKPA